MFGNTNLSLLALVSPDTTDVENEELQRALAASMENMKESTGVTPSDTGATTGDKEDRTSTPQKPAYPPLPEEPKGDRKLLCRVGVRLPDGRRMQRNFLRKDPIQVGIVMKVQICFCMICFLCLI